GDVLISALKAAPNVTVTLIDAQTVQEAIQKAQAENYNVVVIIPEDFSKNIENGEKTYVEVYAVFKGISAGIKESVSEGRINAVLQVLNEELAKLKISEAVNGNPEAILHPIDAKSYSVIQGRIIDVP
ncbi:ABC transporter permease, partial [Thermococcus sp. ES12]|nr:ABC transporter permease [Thermococcus sp. ES12]